MREGLQDGVVLHATSVELIHRAGAVVAPTPPPAPPAPAGLRRPPTLDFSIPLDGETDVAPGEAIWLQFSADLDEASIPGHVLVRLATRRPGDRELVVTLEYDLGRRALRVDPGTALPPGRVVEVVILPGILDVDGRPLVCRLEEHRRRSGKVPEEAVDVLRFKVR